MHAPLTGCVLAEFSSLTELNLASTDLGMSTLKLVGCTPQRIRSSVHRRTHLAPSLTIDTHTHTHTHNRTRTRTRTYVAGVGGGLGLPGLVILNLSNMHLNDEHLVHVASTSHLGGPTRPIAVYLSHSALTSVYLRVVRAELARLRELKVARNVDITNIGANDSIASTNPQQEDPNCEHFIYLLAHHDPVPAIRAEPIGGARCPGNIDLHHRSVPPSWYTSPALLFILR
jgi:hypothetical protein